MRFDHQPDSAPLSGSGFPVPPNGSRWVSSIRRISRLASFGFVCTQYCKSSKACTLNSKRIFHILDRVKNQVLRSRTGDGVSKSLGVGWRGQQSICGVTRNSLLWRGNIESPRQNEFLDRHPGKGCQGFDLPVLLRLNFNSESVHTIKIVKTIKIVNP